MMRPSAATMMGPAWRRESIVSGDSARLDSSCSVHHDVAATGKPSRSTRCSTGSHPASVHGGGVVLTSSVTAAGSGVFSGPLYRTSGPAYNNEPWDGSVGVAEVGSGTFTFTNAAAGSFTYTVDGVTQTKAITRQVFTLPATVCR